MDRAETRKSAVVMQAWADGSDVQQRRLGDMDAQWYTPCKPIWNWDHFEYRIKPEPREWWLAAQREGDKLEIWSHPPAGLHVIRVREVLDD